MRVKFCAAALTLLLMGACLGGSASAAPFVVRPSWLGTPHDMVFTIAMRGGQTWAVGSFGILVKRTPESPWKLISDTGGMAMLGIAFAPNGEGVAVGQAGNLYEAAVRRGGECQRRIHRRRLFRRHPGSAGGFQGLASGEYDLERRDHAASVWGGIR
jgi:hypothetical protein